MKKIITLSVLVTLLILSCNYWSIVEANYYNNVYPQLNEVVEVLYNGNSYQTDFELDKMKRNEYNLDMSDMPTDTIYALQIKINISDFNGDYYDVFIENLNSNDLEYGTQVYKNSFDTSEAVIKLSDINTSEKYKIIIRAHPNHALSGNLEVLTVK